MNLRELPKIELHLHLDCSLSYEAVAELAPLVTREEYDRDFVAPARCTNLADFLSRAPKGIGLMQSESSLELVTQDLFRQLAADGVIYAEIRFAPLLHTGEGLTPERVIEVVDRATARMIRDTGIESRLILCTLRHLTDAQSMATARLVDKFRGGRVVGLDLAADEAGFPLDAHVEAYQFAREAGLYRTAHAGEARGPESVRETLLRLHPHRIGHGTRSIEDPELVEYLRRERILIELCPSANVQIIPSIDSWEHHPIDRLFRAGLQLNVNTDSRMLTPTTLTAEYEGLQRVFGWGKEEFLTTNLMAVEAAFVEDEVKERLRKNLLDVYTHRTQA
jgi:adenosine deaminase